MPTLYEIVHGATVDHALEDGLSDEERRARIAVRDVIAAIGPGVEREEWGGMTMSTILLGTVMVMMAQGDLDETIARLGADIKAQVVSLSDELGPPSFVGRPHELRKEN